MTIAREQAERNPRMAQALAVADAEHLARAMRRVSENVAPELVARLDAELRPPRQTKAPAPKSEAAEAVASVLRCEGIEFVREHRFHPERQWRFDFALEPLLWLVAVEVEGGTFTGGRHTRGKGYENDCQKYNEAAILGWTVLRVPSNTVPALRWLDQVWRAIATRRAA